MADDIAYARIHPAIGVARVGNSEQRDGWFLGPETPAPEPAPVGSCKDDTGAVKRQAARFRLYGYTADGTVVRELTVADPRVTIEWAVHVANKKAAWYEFRLALDIPDMAGKSVPRRNKGVTDRGRLVIDPGRKVLDAATGGTVPFTGGRFLDTLDVPLGSMHTDDEGRLVVLGGKGHSAAPFGEPPLSFGNNDGWCDDISDGPVTATLTLEGRAVPVEPAWVVVAPPNYAPDVKSPRTLYDLLHDLFVQEEMLTAPDPILFDRDIKPVLRRFCELQWVNQGFATHFGFGGPEDFMAPGLLRRLASPSATHRELRRQVFTSMRDHARDGLSPMTWPWFYGDGMSRRPKSPLQYMELSNTQLTMLQRWAEGDFRTTPWPGFPRCLEEAPVADQPGLLDRAALDFCLADAFHPGCEVTWPVRHSSMYSEPFRIRHRPAGRPERPYGETLTQEDVFAADGPLQAQGPGDLTRWMAVPWQTDTASCRSGYESGAGLGPRYDPHLPTFWPARVPNHVLTEDDYRIVNREPGHTAQEAGDQDAGADDPREAAFARRASWLRGLRGTYPEQLRQAVGEWHHFGIVESRPYTVGDGRFPARIQVESTPGFDLTGVSPHRNLVTHHVPEAVAADLGAARESVAAVAEVTGLAPEDITVGYIDKIDPFGEDAADGSRTGGE
ncbi:LodA/GoxA family CTQ-dependent oxidase [Streptomyces lavenduligriseus]|uniref:LodA/GoxA family CTQ-dependent oxidase n=1 Tax=Streptomyces lavenduligriseus TaxID=67315 RepID=A0ABT0P2B9_9ACTN|nr:LodA/GoxA family CTQ-dependent oxidase [Streptomyces lavenduligriseus]MCL3997750.1 LodA/GoxA family CTQ-dependent oxidase [Streptomyces lavenduligriseus]